MSDVPSCGGVSYAKDHGIAVLTYPASRKGLFPGLSSDELVAALTQTHQADFVLLAGFLKVRSGLKGEGLTESQGRPGPLRSRQAQQRTADVHEQQQGRAANSARLLQGE